MALVKNHSHYKKIAFSSYFSASIHMQLNNLIWCFFYLCKMMHSLTLHCVRKVGPDEAATTCSWRRAASCVNPSGPGYHGGLVGSRWILTEQLLQRTWGKRARPASTLVATEKATPVKWPFLEKESSTASVEKDCQTSHRLARSLQHHTHKTRRVTHSIAANNVPHTQGFAKVLLDPTWHLFSQSIKCKW